MKRKTHKLVVTITHQNPVSAEAAREMFYETFCRRPFSYYTTAGRHMEDTGSGYMMDCAIQKGGKR